jgi:hypothetical protein
MIVVVVVVVVVVDFVELVEMLMIMYHYEIHFDDILHEHFETILVKHV